MADLLREKSRACGHHRAQFGGGGGSSASTNTTTTTDSRITQQSGTAVSGNSNTVQVLDGGAINRAFDFSDNTLNKSIDFGQTALTKALDFAFKSNQQTATVLDSQTTLVKNAYEDAKGRGSMTDWIILGGMALAGAVAVAALGK